MIGQHVDLTILGARSSENDKGMGGAMDLVLRQYYRCNDARQ
jgi:acyl CoA:acetate/3-ketoacid CoA transferase beta subunit